MVSVQEMIKRNSEIKKDYLIMRKHEDGKVVGLEEQSKYLSHPNMQSRLPFISNGVKKMVLEIEGYERKYRRSTVEHMMKIEDKCFENVTDTDMDWYRMALRLKREGII